MNENILMENPLAIFKDFEEIPDDAFISDKDEIYGLVRTITNSDDFLLFLVETLNENPEKIEKEINGLKKMYQKAKKGDYSDLKNKAILLFVGDILNTINEIKLFGGAFKRIKVPIYRCHPDAILPKYATQGDAGMDIYTIEDITILPNETKIIRTGLKMAVPGGFYMMAVPKSGLSSKTKMRLSNSPGTIDSGYRGEIGVIIDNIGDEPIHFTKNSKIAQLILQKIPHVEWKELSEEEFNKLTPTERGTGGYGSTGK